MESDCQMRDLRLANTPARTEVPAKTCVPFLHQINTAWLAFGAESKPIPFDGNWKRQFSAHNRFGRRSIDLQSEKRARVIFVISLALIRTLPFNYSWAQFHRSLSIIQPVDWFDLKTSLTMYFYSFVLFCKRKSVRPSRVIDDSGLRLGKRVIMGLNKRCRPVGTNSALQSLLFFVDIDEAQVVGILMCSPPFTLLLWDRVINLKRLHCGRPQFLTF